MADVFYTILIVYVLWRIFGGTTKSHVYHHYTPPKNEGDVTVSQNKKTEIKNPSEHGEYVDFEELPTKKQD